ncbi:MAG: tyrosine-type recombinase/integrase [bacterium]|nr:tyrosine-type recombinase/integrase [bacterium]
MAEEDIYNNGKRYAYQKENLHLLLKKPEDRPAYFRKMGKYYCRNPENLDYFKLFCRIMESKDLSFARRNRLLSTLRFIVDSTDINLKDVDRDEIDRIMRRMHEVNHSPKSKSDFVKDIRCLWKVLFPEKDEKGRIDPALVPYPIRHLSRSVDKSREKRRQDKLAWDEFERILNYFNTDPYMQLFLMLSLEGLGRPQETLYARIKDAEKYDSYARIWISEHGKEGIGYIQCIDSFPYLLKVLEVHPLRDDPDAFLFINLGAREFGTQMKPPNINKKLKKACSHLGISKPITAYSLKRNGVTFRLIRGDSDLEIQHAARWTSTRQLKTYDLSTRDDSYKNELIKRGLAPADAQTVKLPTPKVCQYCQTINGFLDVTCRTCKRTLDQAAVARKIRERDLEFERVKRELEALEKRSAGNDLEAAPFSQNDILQNLVNTVRKLQNEIAAIKR